MNEATLSRHRHQTALFGMWVFIAMETLFFGGGFFLYWAERYANPQAFASGSAHLDLKLAAVNTAVLLTSSFTMATADHYTKCGDRARALSSLLATATFGSAFLILKAYEYINDARNGLWPWLSLHPTSIPFGTDKVYLFYSTYLLLTGLHALHLLIAVLWCTTLTWLMWRRRNTVSVLDTPVEVLGLYWHFVDVIWVLLLPLLYMVGVSA